MNILQVRHIKQKAATSCNAACLAMLYSYFDFDQSEGEIWDRLKSKRPNIADDYYISVENILKDLKQNNFCFIVGRSYWDFESTFQPLEKLINATLPVMVIQRGYPDPSLGHCKVVIGVDDNEIIVNDPEHDSGKTRIDKNKFYEDWEQSGDEVTGGVLLSIFPLSYEVEVETLWLDDVTTNTDKISWIESQSSS